MIITDILNNQWECECIGCSIASKEITPPGGLILETKNFVLHQDPEIPIRGFMIIASKKHISSIAQFSYEEAHEMFDLVYKARAALSNVKDIVNVTIVQEERSKHFHLWLFPRYEWMNQMFDSTLTSVREIMKIARNEHKTEENVREILATAELIKRLVQNGTENGIYFYI